MRRRIHLRLDWRPWLQALGLTLLFNGVFAGVMLLATGLPQGVITERVERAFETRELVEKDYLRFDSRRGWHQYNDCAILQMMTNEDSSSAGRAFGPWIYSWDASTSRPCRTLHALVMQDRSPQSFIASRYTRYWHGYIAPASALLTFFELRTVRSILRLLVYLAVVLLLLSGVSQRRLLPFTAAVGIAGGLFWGLSYFGQSLCHSAGDAAVMLGIAALVFGRHYLAAPAVLIPFCALFGAVVVYFEMLTGPLPIASGLLFTGVYLIVRVNREPERGSLQALSLASTAVIAFALGAVLTLGIKVLIAATWVRPTGLDAYFNNLDYYLGNRVDDGQTLGMLQPLMRLVARGTVLSFGNTAGMAALYVSALAAWAVSIWLAFRRGSREAWVDLSAFVVGAASVPVWSLLLPAHTYIHAGFMARILIVPIALGWASALWQLRVWRVGES